MEERQIKPLMVKEEELPPPKPVCKKSFTMSVVNITQLAEIKEVTESLSSDPETPPPPKKC